MKGRGSVVSAEWHTARHLGTPRRQEVQLLRDSKKLESSTNCGSIVAPGPAVNTHVSPWHAILFRHTRHVTTGDHPARHWTSLVSSLSWLGRVLFRAAGAVPRPTQLGSPVGFARRELIKSWRNTPTGQPVELDGGKLLDPRRQTAPR
ncbi:hypothetical protein Bbelb_125500 [Branchiostoma belcheri]|nr:hypothetical protein Bbelb_125500 [Branchiostoma belcheri]